LLAESDKSDDEDKQENPDAVISDEDEFE